MVLAFAGDSTMTRDLPADFLPVALSPAGEAPFAFALVAVFAFIVFAVFVAFAIDANFC